MTAGGRSEKDKIAHLRFLADRLAGDSWTVDRDDAGTYLISFRANGESAVLATFHDDVKRQEVEFMAEALDLLFRFLDMFDRARARVLHLEAELSRRVDRQRKGDYAAQASMLLTDRVFCRFLESRGAGGPVRDKTAADTRLKSLLAISSKRQLNEDERAKSAWLSLHKDFLNWKRAGG